MASVALPSVPCLTRCPTRLEPWVVQRADDGVRSDDEDDDEDDSEDGIKRPAATPLPLPGPGPGPPRPPLAAPVLSSSTTPPTTISSIPATTESAIKSTTATEPFFLSTTIASSSTQDSFTTFLSTPLSTFSSFTTTSVSPSTSIATVISTSGTDVLSLSSSLTFTSTITSLSDRPTSVNTLLSLVPATTTGMMGSGSTGDDSSSSNRILIITLSTVLSVVGVVVIAIVGCLLYRRHLNKLRLFNRGITPIDDDEIATWKVGQQIDEKRALHAKHESSASSPSSPHHRKSSSLIQYQAQRSPSLDAYPQSPQSFVRHHQSLDLPRSPQSAVLAKAPNARTGLTDDAVPGDDPFVMPPRRNPSKLAKQPSGHYRTRTSRSSSIKSFADGWAGETTQLSPGLSSEASGRRGHSRVYSTSTAPPHLSYNDLHTEVLAGLSPPPTHSNDVGRAIG